MLKGSPESLNRTIQDAARRAPKSVKDTMRLAARSDGAAMTRTLLPKFQDDILGHMGEWGIPSERLTDFMDALRGGADTAVLAQSRNPKAVATIAKKQAAKPGFMQSAEERIFQRGAARAKAKSTVDTAVNDIATRRSSGNPVADANALIDNLAQVAQATDQHPNLPVVYPSTVRSGVGPAIQRVRDVKTPATPTSLFEAATDASGNPTLRPNSVAPPPPGGPGLPPTGKAQGPKFGIPGGDDLVQGANFAARFALGFDQGIPGRNAFPVLFRLPSGPLAWTQGAIDGFQSMFRTEAAMAKATQGLVERVQKTGINAGPGLHDQGINIVNPLDASVKTGAEGISANAWFAQKFPALKGIVGKFNQAYAGALNTTRTMEYLYSDWLQSRYARFTGQPYGLADRLRVAQEVNTLTGVGYAFPKETSKKLHAVANLSHALGIAPNYRYARLRLIPDIAKAAISITNDAAHRRPPKPGDLETLRNGLGYAGSVWTMWHLADAAGLKTDLDMDSPAFLKIDLGPEGGEIAKKAAAANFFGFSTLDMNGHVYLDAAQALGSDIKTIYSLIGPIFGKLPKNMQGHAYNPYQPKGVEQDAFDIVANWAANKGLSPVKFVYDRARGRPYDPADWTENPLTSTLLPLWVQSGISSSGESHPGGDIRLGMFETPEAAVNYEKRKVGAQVGSTSTADLLPAEYQFALNTLIDKSKTAASAALIQSPGYKNADPETQKKMLDNTSSQALKSAKTDYGVALTKDADPEQASLGATLAIESAGNRLEQARTVARIQAQGSLTPDLARRLDAQRKQTDPSKANYEPTVSEYIQGRALSDRWLAAPRFVVGSRQDWDQAAVAAETLKKLVADAKARGRNPAEDKDIQNFYAYSVGGDRASNRVGMLATLYERDGSKREAAISPGRRSIQGNPLWRLFGDATAQAERPIP